MTSDVRMSGARRLVLAAALLLFGVWLATNVPRLAGGPGGYVSFLLGAVFAMLVAVRPKPDGRPLTLRAGILAGLGVLGLMATIAGVVVPVHQFEWVGVLLVLFACLAWALPARYHRDLAIALFLIYWIHPLPSQVFGPLQLTMQRWSVRLSEALLHVLDMRVWGDELVLRAGARVFGVPESCSGMKTAVTVFFCGLGVALLMRFRWYQIALLLAVGMVQVLVLNALRISGIVWFGADRPAEWNAKVLHDTMGIFLVLSVGLIYLDAMLARQWARYRARRRILREINDEVGEWEEQLKRWPTFWRLLFLWWKPVLAVALVAIAGWFGVKRLGPHHRAEMIRGAADALMRVDLENAERAVKVGLAMDPGNAELQLTMATILFERKRYPEVLAFLGRKADAALSPGERVLKARTLLESKRMDEALSLLNGLPEDTRNWPGVAMVMAELHAMLDRPIDVSKELVRASRGFGLQDRIRRLFPYLASRELWDTVCRVDPDMPYAHPIHGVIAATARVRVNDMAGAANILRRAMDGSATDRLYLTPLIAVMLEQPAGEWEGRFDTLVRSQAGMWNAAELTEALAAAFVALRPDLAWIVYAQMSRRFPEEPEVLVAPARFGPSWFVFRRSHFALPGSGVQRTVDARAFLDTAGTVDPWRSVVAGVPEWAVTGGGMSEAERRRRLIDCLALMERLDAEHRLQPRMETLYAEVLGELGRWAEAHARLDGFMQTRPASRPACLLAHAALYRAQQQWESVYEMLSEYSRVDVHPPLSVRLDLASAALALDMGPYAMGVLEEARRVYPNSRPLAMMTANALGYFGFAEDALFLIAKSDGTEEARMRLRFLAATGRVREAERLAGSEGLGVLSLPKKQSELPAPAEWALAWRGGTIGDADYAAEARGLPSYKTPFLSVLTRLKTDWCQRRGQGDVSDAKRWEAAGRDAREQSYALSELAILLARQGRMDEALAASKRAAELSPDWSVLWRLQVVFSGGREDVVERAGQAYPWDSEIWLGRVVSRIRTRRDETGAGAMVSAAVNAKALPAGTLARAADYLLRSGVTNAAVTAARAAIADGQGLLCAYVVGLACAVKTGNKSWAIQCARDGADNAMEPWPFYRLLLVLKSGQGKPDADVVAALESLKARYPDEPIWAERLGDAYFRRGQTEHAEGVLDKTLARAGTKNPPRIRTYLIAAEAARLEGDLQKAIDILSTARKDYPNDFGILNNLVYTMAQHPPAVKAAKAMLPELLAGGVSGFAVYDTAAIVALRAGDIKLANEYAAKAMELVKQEDYAWDEVYLNAAEALVASGQYREARKRIETVRKSSRRSPATEARVRSLLEEIAEHERE